MRQGSDAAASAGFKINVDLLRTDRAGRTFHEDIAGIAGAALGINIGQLVGGDVNGRLLAVLTLLDEETGN